MNRVEIFARAREITDLDSVDVSDTLLTMYLKDGYQRMIEMERRWPFFEVSSTLATVVDQRDYPLSGIYGGLLQEITSLVDATNATRLGWIGYDDAESTWIGGTDSTGVPRYYSLWAQNINLWPKPSAVLSLTLRGYRKATDWTISDSLEVDADLRLHHALIYYVVSEMYRLQEDAELAANYRGSFSEAVKMARDDIMRQPESYPLVLSGNANRGRFRGPNHNGLTWAQ